MTKIGYSVRGSFGEWTSFSGRGNVIEFFGLGVRDGLLILGASEAAIKDGVARISTRSLPDGRYAPTVISGEGVIELEAITVLGTTVTPAPTEERVLRSMLKRLRELEEKNKILEERINELTTEIKGKALFE